MAVVLPFQPILKVRSVPPSGLFTTLRVVHLSSFPRRALLKFRVRGTDEKVLAGVLAVRY